MPKNTSFLEKKIVTGKEVADYLKNGPEQMIEDCADFFTDVHTLTESMHSLYKEKIIPMTLARVNVSIKVCVGDDPVINNHFGAIVGDVTEKDGERTANTVDILNRLQENYTDEEKETIKKFKEANL